MGKSLRIIPNNLFNLILISNTWIINLSPCPPTSLPLSLSLCLSLSLRSNASLTLLPINPPSFTLTHSLHLLREHEPAAVSASLSVFELFWHMCSLSAPPTVLLPSVFPNLRGGPLLPTQDSRESSGRDRQQRRLVIITGRGSGQWPAWRGTVVRVRVRLVLEHSFWTTDDQRTSREAKEKDWLKKSGWEEKPWTDSFTCVGEDKKFSFHSFKFAFEFWNSGTHLGEKKALRRNPVKKERKSTPLQHHLLLFRRQKTISGPQQERGRQRHRRIRRWFNSSVQLRRQFQPPPASLIKYLTSESEQENLEGSLRLFPPKAWNSSAPLVLWFKWWVYLSFFVLWGKWNSAAGVSSVCLRVWEKMPLVFRWSFIVQKLWASAQCNPDPPNTLQAPLPVNPQWSARSPAVEKKEPKQREIMIRTPLRAGCRPSWRFKRMISEGSVEIWML